MFSFSRRILAEDLYSYGEYELAKIVFTIPSDVISKGLEKFWDYQKEDKTIPKSNAKCMVYAIEGKARELKFKRRKLKNNGFFKFYIQSAGFVNWITGRYEKSEEF